jgi:hypothetical protein
MRIALAVLFAMLAPAPCGAEGGDGTGSVRSTAKYFYVVPEGVQDEWAYAKRECEVITPSLRRDLRNCIAFERHQMCESSKSVELSNVLTNERRSFMLLHHVFSTKSACAKSRDETLKGH